MERHRDAFHRLCAVGVGSRFLTPAGALERRIAQEHLLHTHRQTDRHTDRQTHKHTHTHTRTRTHTHTHTHREREREREYIRYIIDAPTQFTCAFGICKFSTENEPQSAAS